MAKVTLPLLASFHRGDLHLFRGENPDIPTEVAVTLMSDTRFIVEFEKGEDINAALKCASEDAIDETGMPKDKTRRLGVIAGAILFTSLNADDYPGSTTAAGKVDARHLTKLLGWQVTSVDRDEAQTRMEKGSIDIIDFELPETAPEPGNQTTTDDNDDGSTLDTGSTQTPPQSATKPKGKITISSKPDEGTSNPVQV